MIEHVIGDHRVERCVAKRERLRVGLREGKPMAQPREIGARFADHPPRHVG
jgi:hypothetical protein